MASLLFEQQGHWIGVVPLRAVEDRQRLKQIVTAWNVPHVGYVDLKEESNRLMTAYRDRTFSVVLWGGVAIADSGHCIEVTQAGRAGVPAYSQRVNRDGGLGQCLGRIAVRVSCRDVPAGHGAGA